MTCPICNRPREDHFLANYADGPMVGLGFLVCPHAVWVLDPSTPLIPVPPADPIVEIPALTAPAVEE